MDDWRRGRNLGSGCGCGEKVTFTVCTVSNREDFLLLSTIGVQLSIVRVDATDGSSDATEATGLGCDWFR